MPCLVLRKGRAERVFTPHTASTPHRIHAARPNTDPHCVHTTSTPHPRRIHNTFTPHPLRTNVAPTPHPRRTHAESKPHQHSHGMRTGVTAPKGGTNTSPSTKDGSDATCVG